MGEIKYLSALSDTESQQNTGAAEPVLQTTRFHLLGVASGRNRIVAGNEPYNLWTAGYLLKIN